MAPISRYKPSIWVFAVDQDNIQISWRCLDPGLLRVEPFCADRVVAEPIVLTLGTAAEALNTSGGMYRCDGGAATLMGLPRGQLLNLKLSGSALGTHRSGFNSPTTLSARTLRGAPGEELFRLATISDMHLGARSFGHRAQIRDTEGYSETHTWRCASSALTEASEWGGQYAIAKGDLTNSGLADQWRLYARLVEESSIPLEGVAGNHDTDRYGGRKSLSPSDAAKAFGFTLASPLLVRDLPGVRVLIGDTTVHARSAGSLHKVANEIIELSAETPKDQGVLVVLHHHIHPHALPEGPPVGIARSEGHQFLDSLGSVHPNVFVTSGHSHRNRRWARSGVTVTQVGATQDYPGVWAGYRVHEGGLSQIVRRIESPECTGWSERARRAGLGAWEHVSPGRLDSRCFDVDWAVPYR